MIACMGVVASVKQEERLIIPTHPPKNSSTNKHITHSQKGNHIPALTIPTPLIRSSQYKER